VLLLACGGGGTPTTPAAPTYSVGGTLTGLSAGKSVSVSLNGSAPIVLSANGVYSSGSGAVSGTNYIVTIAAQPVNATCTVSNGTGTIASSNVTNVSVTCVDTPVGNIALKVVNASTGLGITGALIKIGDQNIVTDAQGKVLATDVVAANRVPVVVTANNFAEGLGVVSVSNSATADLLVKLLPVGATATIDNAVGGTVTVAGSSAQVVLPANSFNTTGNVTIKLTPVNPALDASVMPGDFTSANGTQNIESFGALIVTPTDSSGLAVNLATGKTATIRIPAVSKSGNYAPTIPLYYVDKATGSWVQEGTATLAGVAPNQYYEGIVSHFSTWNADRAVDSVTYTSCVKDTLGAPVVGVIVTSDGIDYIGKASTVTDSAGKFTVSMKKSATASITGAKGADLLTNTISKTSSLANLTDTVNCLILAPIANSIKIKLTWGQNPRDIDSHLFTPSGTHIYFGSKGSLTAAPFANLDVDDTTSYGPEVVTINRLMVGTYSYGIDLYAGSGTITASPTQVELNIGGNLRVFTPPAGEPASYPYLSMFTMTVAANCAVTINAVNTWLAYVPSTPVASTPVYCTAP
jgi:hypothetical protein